MNNNTLSAQICSFSFIILGNIAYFHGEKGIAVIYLVMAVVSFIFMILNSRE